MGVMEEFLFGTLAQVTEGMIGLFFVLPSSRQDRLWCVMVLDGPLRIHLIETEPLRRATPVPGNSCRSRHRSHRLSCRLAAVVRAAVLAAVQRVGSVVA